MIVRGGCTDPAHAGRCWQFSHPFSTWISPTTHVAHPVRVHTVSTVHFLALSTVICGTRTTTANTSYVLPWNGSVYSGCRLMLCTAPTAPAPHRRSGWRRRSTRTDPLAPRIFFARFRLWRRSLWRRWRPTGYHRERALRPPRWHSDSVRTGHYRYSLVGSFIQRWCRDRARARRGRRARRFRRNDPCRHGRSCFGGDGHRPIADTRKLGVHQIDVFELFPVLTLVFSTGIKSHLDTSHTVDHIGPPILVFRRLREVHAIIVHSKRLAEFLAGETVDTLSTGDHVALPDDGFPP